MADGTILLGVEIDQNDLNKSMGGLKRGLTKGAKVFGVLGAAAASAFAAVGTGLLAITKQAASAYAEYEQLVGGVETLFGTGGKSLEEYAKSVNKTVSEIEAEYRALESAQAEVLAHASEAYRTAGMSQNEYMSTVTSFSASLISSLNGDTEKAARIADQAIIDMSDNANKMGTSMEAIQNAYQGFAKQNYTMLDNLKLGYGGTRTEMERLIEDANRIREANGEMADLSIESFADVTEAIHTIQDEMGITGTTAKEAATTIQGSLSMTKAAWENLLTGLADGNADIEQLVKNLMDSVSAFVGNLMPVVMTALEQLPTAIGSIISGIGAAIESGSLSEAFSRLLSSASELVNQIPALLVQLTPVLVQLVQQIGQVIITSAPTLLKAGIQIIVELANGLSQAAPDLIAQIPPLIKELLDVILDNLDILIEAGIELILALVDGLTEALPELIDYLPEIVIAIVDALIENAPTLIEAAFEIILALSEGLLECLPELVKVIPDLIGGIGASIIEHSPDVASSGLDIVKNVGQGIIDYLSELASAAIETVTSFKDSVVENADKVKSAGAELLGKIKEGISEKAGSVMKTAAPVVITAFVGGFATIPISISNVGRRLVEGIWKGISGAAGWLSQQVRSFCSGIVNTVKSAFQIHSPSRVMIPIGEMLARGIAVGIEQAEDYIKDAFDYILTDARSEVQKVIDEANEELLDSERWYAEESARIERERDEAQYKEKLAAAKTQEEIDKVIADRENELARRAEDDYIAGLKDTADRERKIFEARQKDIENHRKDLVDYWQSQIDMVTDAIKELGKEQENLAGRLKKVGDLFAEETPNEFANYFEAFVTPKKLADPAHATRELTNYADMLLDVKNRSNNLELFEYIRDLPVEEGTKYARYLLNLTDAEFEKYLGKWETMAETEKRVTRQLFTDIEEEKESGRALADLEDDNRALEEYRDNLLAIQKRGVPKEFFEQLREMGTDEAIEYTRALLGLSDHDFDRYLTEWEKKQVLANDISKALYKDEAKEIVDMVYNTFGDSFDYFEELGQRSGEEYGYGFLAELKSTIAKAEQIIQPTVSGLFQQLPDVSNVEIRYISPLAAGAVAPSKTFGDMTVTFSPGEIQKLSDAVSESIGRNIDLGHIGNVTLKIGERELGTVNAQVTASEARRMGAVLT